MSRFFCLVVLWAISLRACANPSVSPTTTLPPQPGPLLNITATGGLCVYGACRSEMSLNTDGVYILRRGDGLNQQGSLDKDRIAQLTEAVRSADFNGIKSHPF